MDTPARPAFRQGAARLSVHRQTDSFPGRTTQVLSNDPMRTDTMQKLTRDKLYTLEKYAEVRNDFRAKVIAHKKNRQVHIGPHASLYFEDFLTMQYQVQEMLRAEKIFEAEGIAEEVAAYNPLIPHGSNGKATVMT